MEAQEGVQADLPQEEIARFEKIAKDLPILADMSRADLLLYARLPHEDALLLWAHAQPHSSTPLYDRLPLGERTPIASVPGVGGRVHMRRVHTINVRGATVARQVFPIYRADHSHIVGYLVRDAYWLAYERHRRRSRVFQKALDEFTHAVLRGDLEGAEGLSPFGEHDGIVYVGPDRCIQYMSGIAAELYRNLGYRDSLIGRRVSEIETIDHQLVMRAINERRCYEVQVEQGGMTWVRKAIPIIAPPKRGLFGRCKPLQARVRRVRGVFILIHDATEALRTQRELEARMALVREVHHRVKNNLQIIASIMRMQARRTIHPEARAVLEESVHRILSVAVVHEFLSQNAKGTINLKEVAHRIMAQIERGLVSPDKTIQLSVQGPDIWLPAERATQCALVINELVQNAIEHGMAHRDAGRIDVELVDHGDSVSIRVTDNGEGLPDGFDLATDAHLGLQIVRNMVQRDLRGQFTLHNSPYGVQAHVRFAKTLP